MTEQIKIACAIMVVALCPIIGNALAMPMDNSRRIIQFTILLIATASYIKIRGPNLILNRLSIIIRKRFFLEISAVCVALLFIAILTNMLTLNFVVTLPDIARLFFTLAFAISIAAVYSTRTASLADISPTKLEIKKGKFYFHPAVHLSVLGLILAVIGWRIGPPPGEAFFTFGGSQIFASICATFGYFGILFLLPLKKGLLFSLPFAYLLFVTTARTALFLMIPMLVLYAFTQFKAGPGRQLFKSLSKAISSLIAPPLVLLIFVVGPILLESRWYPFYLEESKAHLASERVDEFYNRFGRVVRFIGGTGIVDLGAILASYQKMVSKHAEQDRNEILADKSKTEIEDDIETTTEKNVRRFETMLARSNSSETRLDLLKDSVSLIAQRPFTGYWPRLFEDEIAIECSAGVKCAYPHNILLDIAYNFGVIVMAIFIVGLIAIVGSFFRVLVNRQNLTKTILSVSVFVYLLGVQVTGTFVELVIPLILIFFWINENLAERYRSATITDPNII